MSVRNVLDDTFPVIPSNITNISLTYTAGTSSITVDSFYTNNGAVCTLLIPGLNITGANGGTITITIPDAIIPAQTVSIYGFIYNNTSSIVAKLVASSNTITLMDQNATSLVEGNFPVDSITLNNRYITYQTN